MRGHSLVRAPWTGPRRGGCACPWCSARRSSSCRGGCRFRCNGPWRSSSLRVASPGSWYDTSLPLRGEIANLWQLSSATQPPLRLDAASYGVLPPFERGSEARRNPGLGVAFRGGGVPSLGWFAESDGLFRAKLWDVSGAARTGDETRPVKATPSRPGAGFHLDFMRVAAWAHS